MKLWQKDYGTAGEIERFTVGKDRELDLHLAPYDVLGSMAHARMLEQIGLLSAGENADLQKALAGIYADISEGNFRIEEGVEDVHSQVEFILTEKLGDTGKKIHGGRSRNDQVLLDLKLYMRAEIRQIADAAMILSNKTLEMSELHKDKLMPGYTHTQIAMPSSFGLWFGSLAEGLADDLELLQAAYRIADRNPLGSAAGYGSSFPLNRTLTTQLLGFDDLSYNVVYAQNGRGKTELSLSFAIASLAGTVGKFAADVCLFMCQNMGFVTLADEFTTGSSIMPHKKNPDVFELVRAKCNRLRAVPTEITSILGNLTTGYHRDLQLIKEIIIPAVEEIKDCLGIVAFSLPQLSPRENILEDEKYRYLFSVETVNKEVLAGSSFRDAYRLVGKQIADGNYVADREVNHTHEGSIGNLCNDKIAARTQKTYAGFRFEGSDKMYDLLKI